MRFARIFNAPAGEESLPCVRGGGPLAVEGLSSAILRPSLKQNSLCRLQSPTSSSRTAYHSKYRKRYFSFTPSFLLSQTQPLRWVAFGALFGLTVPFTQGGLIRAAGTGGRIFPRNENPLFGKYPIFFLHYVPMCPIMVSGTQLNEFVFRAGRKSPLAVKSATDCASSR